MEYFCKANIVVFLLFNVTIDLFICLCSISNGQIVEYLFGSRDFSRRLRPIQGLRKEKQYEGVFFNRSYRILTQCLYSHVFSNHRVQFVLVCKNVGQHIERISDFSEVELVLS